MSDQTTLEQLLSPATVAKLEDCSVTTVFKRLRDREYTAIRDGVRTKIFASSVEARRAGLPVATYTPLGQPGPRIEKKRG